MALILKAPSAPGRLRPVIGSPRGQVTEIQRSRMLAAAVDTVAEVGFARMTVARVIRRARVSRKTFYDVFADREDCFLAAFDQGLEQARSLATDAYARESGWLDGMRAALARVLRLMDEEPGLARLCVVEALGAGEHVLERRAQALRDVVAAIDRGRSVANASGDPSELTAEGVLGAITAVLHARLRSGAGRGALTDLLGPLMSIIALPYLGADAAASELSRPPLERHVRARPSTRPPPTDPLKGLNMRLTYRTVRVLTVISEQPGASNREIGERSGIADPGQISKLLTRLARLELIENAGEGQERGAANAWHLSTRGAQIERATRPR